MKRTEGKEVTQSKRFVAASEAEMEQICKRFVPKNIRKATNLVVKVFEQCRMQRNEMTNADGKLCPSNLLECPELSELNYWLSRFAVEARQENRNAYPARTLSNLLAGLNRHCQECDTVCPNFMNRKDPRFKELNGAIQVRSRELRESGVGAVVKHAAVITEQEEHMLWESKAVVFGMHSSLLINVLIDFAVSCLIFCVVYY